MQWLLNLPVARKFVFAFGIVCGLSVLLGAYTFTTLRGIAEKNAEVSDNSLPSVVALAEIRGAINVLRREDLHLLLCTTSTCMKDEGPKRQKAIDSYYAAVKAYEPLISQPGERELFQKFSTSFVQYVEGSNRGSELMAANNTGDAVNLLLSDNLRIPLEAALVASQEDLDMNIKAGTEASHEATGASKSATWVTTVATLLIVMLSALIGSVLTKVIAPRLTRVLAALEGLENKDLTAFVRATGTDEIGRVANAFEASVT
jgi:methyl-accepting chemotaxis protein